MPIRWPCAGKLETVSLLGWLCGGGQAVAREDAVRPDLHPLGDSRRTVTGPTSKLPRRHSRRPALAA